MGKRDVMAEIIYSKTENKENIEVNNRTPTKSQPLSEYKRSICLSAERRSTSPIIRSPEK
jgi:hypothetical protein